MAQIGKNGTWRTFSRIAQAALLPLAVAIVFSGCPHPLPEVKPAKYVAPSPSQVPDYKGGPISLPPPDEKGEGADAALQPSGGTYSLSNLVDTALKINPTTRYAWAQAMASAANWGRARSSYYPQVDGSVQAVGGRIPAVQGGTSNVQGNQSYMTLDVSLTYLLLDFGSRSAQAEAARQALIAANWNHNQAMQDVLRNVPQAYYTFIAYRALVQADEKSLKEAETTVSATEERLRSGVSTIADVLQAKSNADQVRLRLASDRGQTSIAKGNLATAVGWLANQRFEISPEPNGLPSNGFARNVDELVELAQKSRPELGVALSTVHQKEAQLKQARAMPFPKLSGGGTFQWLATRSQNGSSYYGGLGLSVPIFHGFDMENALRAARADLDAANAALKTRQENVVSEVWNAYQNYQTSAEQIVASKSLLASASQSFDASLARYREGAADIVELLNAQSVLADARAQVIGARMGLYVSYAELVHAIGSELPVESSQNVSRTSP